MTNEPPLGDGIVRVGESFGIGNEFTGVQVRKVWTRQGERLELHVPRRGYRILLDAMQLEIIAAQDPERFSELFAVSFGADDRAEGEGDV
ncbi:hypothetical protein [Streptomyces sp. S465]|uniref:hypothetical protein n=1 Tax=Streptomyces sp. S465 TaxID=2979468 RepID=UPI0022A83F5B|nr:hypothetical protein [Streptomyces sp. S465]WAP54761.1 hypothetical protein N6H00_07045 [Streptomyces sp. S465]